MHDERGMDLNSPSVECDDPTLMAALASEDVTALDHIYGRYGGLVFALAFRILRNRSDAEEVTSEVFWELWNRRTRYDKSRGSPRSYILLLARSRAIDRIRERPDAIHVSMDAGHHDERFVLQDTGDRNLGTGCLEVDWQVTQAKLQRAIGTLDKSQQIALDLAFFQGLSHRQIADRLASPLGTVKTHIRKGLLKLKQLLGTVE